MHAAATQRNTMQRGACPLRKIQGNPISIMRNIRSTHMRGGKESRQKPQGSKRKCNCNCNTAATKRAKNEIENGELTSFMNLCLEAAVHAGDVVS